MFSRSSEIYGASADRRRGLPDLLNFAFAEDDYTIVMKDGARLVAFECHGPDLNSASPEELDAHRALANRAFMRLDEGFAYQVDLHPLSQRGACEAGVCRSGKLDDRSRRRAALRAGRPSLREPDRAEHRLASAIGGAEQGRARIRLRRAPRTPTASASANGSSSSCRNSSTRSARYGSWCRSRCPRCSRTSPPASTGACARSRRRAERFRSMRCWAIRTSSRALSRASAAGISGWFRSAAFRPSRTPSWRPF